MPNPLRELLSVIFPSPFAESGEAHDRALRLAVAVLVVEVMRAERGFGEAERRAAVEALRTEFGLGSDDVSRLLQTAVQTADNATDFFTFTSRINDSFDMPRKLALIEQLWRVVWADGELGANENHVMRKIADLLYIPQGPYIHAKMRAREA